MYPGEAGALGHECSGVVTGIGPGVTGLQPGQPVLALAGDCFASYAVARGEFVMPKPAGMSFEQAASVPITFLTAAYALETLGGMRSGERVLIHAAAGGVGLAAVQLARSAGLEIFATAGSPEKRAFLHRLGVQHVLDSRSLAFAAEIMRRTNGQGVDLVLNSLADEWIPASLGVLRAGGRFLEIGKRGIWTPEQVAALGKGIDYHIIYLGEVCERQPALINDLFTRLMARFAAGDLQPLPWRAFPLAQAVEAFRFMAQARHVGKIVLTQPPAPNGPPAIRPEATYLVTGGLGGLGLVAAGRLVEAGARRLVLAGRSAPGPAAAVALEQMAARGAQVVVLQADLSQAAEVERLLETIRREHPPLAGIVHAAGRLQDGLLAQQDWSRFSEVLAPKLGAAWALHRLTSDAASPQALDFFVLFSAGAGWLGSAGQTGYAAANTALDALACYRQARGLPAVSIAWGPWAEVGMAARLDAAGQERLNRQGLGAITPHQGAELFERLLGAGGALAALPVDWARYAASQAGPAPRFRELAGRARPAASAGKPARPAAAPDVLQRLSEAAPSKRKSLLQAHIREQAIRVLGLSLTFALDSRQPLRELGLDSLMAVELRNALGASLQRKLTATLLFDYPTLEALTDYLSQELWPAEAEAPAAVQPQAEQQAAAQEIDELQKLSEAEAEALLLQELASLKKGRS
jgi:NADPH:quinone reductase-like Zn-dependent oxidoreductase/acyl carrier protein